MLNTRDARGLPVASFPLPPGAPDDVVAAEAEFRRIASEWSTARFALREAEQAVEQEQTDRVRALADAVLEGKPAPKQAEKAEAALDDLRVTIAGLSVALDEAGNKLARAVQEARGAWLDDATAVRKNAEDEYLEAVRGALAAAVELGRATSAEQWLRGFDLTASLNGKQRGADGRSGPIPVKLPRGFSVNSSPSAQQVLEIASKALDPPPARHSSSASAAESRFGQPRVRSFA